MFYRPALALLCSALLIGCSTPPSTPSTPPVSATPSQPVTALGLMEVHMSGVGTARMQSSAHAALSPQGLTSVGGLQLRPDSNGYADRDGYRYVWATFKVRNATPNGTPNATSLSNLTFMAASVDTGPLATASGTPFRNLKRFDGSTYTEPKLSALARSFQPTQKLDTSGSLTPIAQGSDLQLFSEAAVAEGQWFNTSSAPLTYAELGVGTVLPYGFVVRNPAELGTSNERTLPSVAADNRPVADQFDGLVTFAVKLPLQADPADNPFTFSMVFEVGQDSVIRVTQTQEEQNAAGNTLATQRVQTLGATEVTVLPGSSLATPAAGLDRFNVLCSVRLSGPASAPTSSFPNVPLPAVGEVTRVQGSNATLCLPGGTTGAAEYTILPFNEQSSAQQLSALARQTVSVTGPPNPSIGATTPPLGSLGALSAETAISVSPHPTEQLPLPNAATLVNTKQLSAQALPTFLPATGDKMTLNVAQGCSGATDLRTGTVRRVGTQGIIVTDDANPAGGYSEVDLDELITLFDSKVWPVTTGAFGTPTDLDTNQRVVIFITRAVNELSPPASSTVNYGYFDARDLYDSSSCSRSNMGEALYMLAPDPTGTVNSNVRPVSTVKGNFGPTVAHEMQHLINASRRLYVNGSVSLEDPWLNEALSNFAEELMFYNDSVGLPPRQNIVVTNLTTGPNASRRVAAYNTYANPNYSRLRSFVQRPDLYGPIWTTDSLGARGAAWQFLRYASDRYAANTPGATDSGPGSLTYALVNSTSTGLANLDAVLGGSSQAFLRDWTVATYVDDAVPGISPAFQQLSWNYRSIYTALGGTWITPRLLNANTTLTLNYQMYATSFLRAGVNVGTTGTMLLRAPVGVSTDKVSYAVVRTK